MEWLRAVAKNSDAEILEWQRMEALISFGASESFWAIRLGP